MLEDLIRRRAAELPDSARRLLDVVALAGRPLELSVAFQAAALDEEAEAALAALRGVHLIRTRRSSTWDEVEPYHDRIRAAVIGGIAPEEARRTHERLASALLASARADPERLAEHFREAGHAEEASHYAAEAADAAADALAFDRAARLFRLALELRPAPGPEAHELRVRLGTPWATRAAAGNPRTRTSPPWRGGARRRPSTSSDGPRSSSSWPGTSTRDTGCCGRPWTASGSRCPAPRARPSPRSSSGAAPEAAGPAVPPA